MAEEKYDPRKHLIKTRGGKLYLPVAARILWLTTDREEGGYEIRVDQEVIHVDAERAVIKTVLTVPGRGTATGIKSETKAGFANYVEKAATGSLGRAATLLGYGTEYALELWEEDMPPGGEIGEAVDTPRAAPERTQGRTVATSAGGATLVQRAGAALGATQSGKDAAAQQRRDQANAEIKRLAKEHGYTPPASYAALLKLAAEQYGYTKLPPVVASAAQISPALLEEFVAHMKHVGGDPSSEEATPHTEDTPSPFEQAPHDAQDPAAQDRYARAIADLRRALDAYTVTAQLDDVIALVRTLHAEGCVRSEDRVELEEQHARRVREIEEARGTRSA